MLAVGDHLFIGLGKHPDIQELGGDPPAIQIAQDQEATQNGRFTIKNDGSSYRDIQADVSITGQLQGRITLGLQGNNNDIQAVGKVLTLPKNDSASLYYEVDTTGLSTGPYTATVTITDQAVPNDTKSIPIHVQVGYAKNPMTDLEATVSASASQIQSGQSVTYTFSYKNNGPLDSQYAKMTANIPSGLSVVSVASSNGKAQDTDTVVGGIIDNAPLAVGQTVTVTVVCQADGTSSTERLPVTGNIELSDVGSRDRIPENNSQTIYTTIIPSPSTQNPLIGTWTGTYSGSAKDANDNIVSVSGTVTLVITAATLSPDGLHITLVGTLNATGFFGETISGSLVGQNQVAVGVGTDGIDIQSGPGDTSYVSFNGTITGNTMQGNLWIGSGRGTITVPYPSVTLTK